MQLDKKNARSCKLINTTKEQDQKMTDVINRTSAAPGEYTFTNNNCVNFVRKVLEAGGIESSGSIAPYPFFNALPGKEFKP